VGVFLDRDADLVELDGLLDGLGIETAQQAVTYLQLPMTDNPVTKGLNPIHEHHFLTEAAVAEQGVLDPVYLFVILDDDHPYQFFHSFLQRWYKAPPQAYQGLTKNSRRTSGPSSTSFWSSVD
jgi:hypothetical protein